MDTWKNKELANKWGVWLQEIESFSSLPMFFQIFIKDKYSKDLLFKVHAGIPDTDTTNAQYWSDNQADALQNYKIISEIFSNNKQADIRENAVKNGIIDKIFKRLQIITGEVQRKEENEDADTPNPGAEANEASKAVKSHEKK